MILLLLLLPSDIIPSVLSDVRQIRIRRGPRWQKCLTRADKLLRFQITARTMKNLLILAISTAIVSSTQIDTNLYAGDSSCVCDYKQNVDYFPDKVDSAHAATYDVTYFDSYKVVNTSTSTYVLYQCGTPVPDLNTTYPDATYVSIPLQRVFVGSTTFIPWIEFLGERRSIVAVSGANSISSPCLNKRLNENDDLVDAYNPSTWSVNTTLLEEVNVDGPSARPVTDVLLLRIMLFQFQSLHNRKLMYLQRPNMLSSYPCSTIERRHRQMLCRILTIVSIVPRLTFP